MATFTSYLFVSLAEGNKEDHFQRHWLLDLPHPLAQKVILSSENVQVLHGAGAHQTCSHD